MTLYRIVYIQASTIPSSLSSLTLSLIVASSSGSECRLAAKKSGSLPSSMRMQSISFITICWRYLLLLWYTSMKTFQTPSPSPALPLLLRFRFSWTCLSLLFCRDLFSSLSAELNQFVTILTPLMSEATLLAESAPYLAPVACSSHCRSYNCEQTFSRIPRTLDILSAA